MALKKRGIWRKCLICKNLIYITKCHFKKKRFCSKLCFSKWFSKTKKGEHFSPKTEFKKGVVFAKDFRNKMGAKGAKNYFWKGGKYKTGKGYIMVHSPLHPYRTKDGYVREHRLIMEKSIGRYLSPAEQVHHINGSVNDNCIANLMLFKNGAEHTKYHHRIKTPAPANPA